MGICMSANARSRWSWGTKRSRGVCLRMSSTTGSRTSHGRICCSIMLKRACSISTVRTWRWRFAESKREILAQSAFATAARRSTGQLLEDAIAYRLHRADAVDPHVARRARLAGGGASPVVLDQGLGLGVVDGEAGAHGVLAVVVALHQRFAGDVVAARLARGIELDVIGAPRRQVHAPPAHAADDLL